MKKKLVSLLLVSAMVMGTLTACGGSDKPAGGEAASGSSKAESAVSEAAESAASEAAGSSAAEEEASSVSEAAAPADEASSASSAAEAAAEAAEAVDGDKNPVLVFGPDPGSLEPFNFSIFYYPYMHGVFDMLFYRTGRNGEYTPGLGESWEQIDDTTYEIKIFDGIYDAENNPLTAKDVVFSWDTWDELGTCESVFGCYDHAEAVDDTTVRLYLNATNYGYIQNYLLCTPIVTEAAYTSHDMKTDPVGAGPYKVKSWTPGTSLVLEKNDNYWCADDIKNPKRTQNADTITYQFLQESSQIGMAMENGEVDFASSLSETELNRLTAMDDFYEFDQLSDLGMILMYNCAPGKLMDNVNLRKAVSYGINVDDIINGAYQGKAEPLTSGGFFNSDEYIDDYAMDDYYSYNPEKCKELLAEEGYDEKNPLTVRLMVQGDELQQAIATVIQADLGVCGVNVEILTYDSSTFTAYQTDYDQYDMFIVGLGAYFVTDILKWVDERTYGGHGMNGIEGTELQELIEVCNDTPTHNDETCLAAMNWVNENVPYYGLVMPYYTWTVREGIEVTNYDGIACTHTGAWDYSGLNK